MELGPEFTPIGEKCAVVATFSPEGKAAILTYKGLMVLQHRGQEASGIAVQEDNGNIEIVANEGLVTQVFDGGKKLLGYAGATMAIGHNRYSTTGAEDSTQPIYGDHFAMGHNGNITNGQRLSEIFDTKPPETYSSDSHHLADIIAQESSKYDSLQETLAHVLPHVEGAYTLVLMTAEEIIGIRDPNGFRPLVMGETEDGGRLFASEMSALSIARAKFVREIEPGEIITINREGEERSIRPFKKAQHKLCAFEFDYFSRPDTDHYGENVHEVRKRKGSLLAKQSPVSADIVIPLPNSGRSASKGFSDESGIELDEGFVKTELAGRTFIVPGISTRPEKVRDKLIVIRSVVVGKRVVAIDDSIVHGTTTKEVTRMLREAGATEVHWRIASPPYRWPCFYGMNTSVRNKLIASHMTVKEIAEHIEADSLEYLEYDNMLLSLGSAATKVCTACMTGDYPTEVPVDLGALRTPADDIYELR